MTNTGSYGARIGLALLLVVLAMSAAGADDESRGSTPTERPPARSGLMACAVDGLIYVSGGVVVGGEDAPRLDVWSPQTKLWSRLPAPPCARALGAMVNVEHRIYLIGGLGADNKPVPSVDVFDIRTHEWEEPIDDPHPASRNAAVAYGSSICVIGGIETDDLHSSRVRMLDTNNNRWREQSPLNQGRHGHAAALRDGRIYITGGYAAAEPHGLEQTTSVEISDELLNWHPGSALTRPHAFHGMANIDDRLLVFGTRGDDRALEVLRPKEDQWIAGPPIPAPRHRFGCAVVGSKLYVIDGEDERGDVEPSIMIYDSDTNEWKHHDEG